MKNCDLGTIKLKSFPWSGEVRNQINNSNQRTMITQQGEISGGGGKRDGPVKLGRKFGDVSTASDKFNYSTYRNVSKMTFRGVDNLVRINSLRAAEAKFNLIKHWNFSNSIVPRSDSVVGLI